MQDIHCTANVFCSTKMFILKTCRYIQEKRICDQFLEQLNEYFEFTKKILDDNIHSATE